MAKHQLKTGVANPIILPPLQVCCHPKTPLPLPGPNNENPENVCDLLHRSVLHRWETSLQSPVCNFAFFLCQLVARMRRAAPHFALRTTPFGNAAMPHPAMNHHWMVHRKCHFFYCLLVKKKNSYNASWALNNHPDATPVAAPITQFPNSFGVLWIDLQRPIIAILEGLLAVKKSKLRKSDPSIIQGELSNNNQIKTNDTRYHFMCTKKHYFVCIYNIWLRTFIHSHNLNIFTSPPQKQPRWALFDFPFCLDWL